MAGIDLAQGEEAEKTTRSSNVTLARAGSFNAFHAFNLSEQGLSRKSSPGSTQGLSQCAQEVFSTREISWSYN